MKLLICLFTISIAFCYANTITEKTTTITEAVVETTNESPASNLQKGLPAGQPGKGNNLWPTGIFGAGALPEEFPAKNLLKIPN